MSYPQESLEDLCRIVIGRTPSRSEPSYWGEGNKWVSISDLDGKIVRKTKEEITDHAVRSARCRRVAKGTLLFSFKLTIGKMAFAGEDLFTNEAIAALEIKNSDVLSASYLYYALRSARFGGSNQAAKGKTLNSKSLAKIEIPVPPLDDQIRIAHLLGKVEGLIAQRKQHLQQLDDLLKSVFMEMFGDPVRNAKGWVVQPLGLLSEVQGGLQVTSKRSENPVEAPYLRVANVYRDRLDLAEIKTMRVTKVELERVRLKKGDLLIVEGHGNPEEVGRSAVWDGSIEDCVHQNHLIRVRVNTAIITELYTSYFINSAGGRAQMLRAGKTTSGLNTISSRNIKDTQIPIPPIELQHEFASVVEKCEALKTCCQQSLADFQELYGVLSQRAFNGELDLSRVALPPVVLKGESPAAAVVSTPIASSVINLPETDLLLQALEDSTHLQSLLHFWLDAYRAQLGNAAFSVERFIDAAQTRLAELHPDNDFEFGADAYDHIKAWVFNEIRARNLKQTRDIVCVDGRRQFGNKVLLRARRHVL